MKALSALKAELANLKVAKQGKIWPEERPEVWLDYVQELGITPQDYPQLLEIVRESDLEGAYEGCSPEECIPVHAWRAIAQLKQPDAVRDLYEVLIDEKNEEAFWFKIEFPTVMQTIGPDAIPLLSALLHDHDSDWGYKMLLVESLLPFAASDQTHRSAVIRSVHDVLRDYQNHDPEYIGAIIKEIRKIHPKEISETVVTIMKNDGYDLSGLERDEDVWLYIE